MKKCKNMIILILGVVIFYLWLNDTNKDYAINPAEEKIYGLKKYGNNVIVSSMSNHVQKKIRGLSTHLSIDKNSRMWVPIEEGGNQVYVLQGNKIVYTYNDLPSPIRVVHSDNNFTAVLCVEDGVNGKVVIINNESMNIIKTISLKGLITNAVFHNDRLYVTANEMLNEQDSYLHKIDLITYKTLTINLDGQAARSLDADDKNVYVGLFNPRHTNLVIYRADTLEKLSHVKVPPAPYKLKLFKDKLYILHFDITSFFGRILTIVDTNTKSVTSHSIPLLADDFHITNHELILSSSVEDSLFVLSSDSLEIKEKKPFNGLLSNTVVTENGVKN
ncbi:hypothetical protein QO009_002088 [Brevibacillus aydinogluensis]|uniref:YncE family protein n=1 Tax=Brevibacillus aydinogluensis TaxID=927786 RepID=UPI002892C22A|nr:hypothetical protein [Brevibacillus aydinogluensis]MDT3416220.1 hypothetical protein [Brevibacillus aydinogluensis]